MKETNLTEIKRITKTIAYFNTRNKREILLDVFKIKNDIKVIG